jgi:lysozyme
MSSDAKPFPFGPPPPAPIPAVAPSQECYDLIMKSEGFRAQVYKDATGNPTIGYGHKIVHAAEAGETWTEPEAEIAMKADAAEACGQMLGLVKVKLTQGQVDALTDFVFNMGSHRLAGSTLLRKLNAGLYSEIPGELNRWVYAGTEVLPGLVTRRAAEVTLWNKN